MPRDALPPLVDPPLVDIQHRTLRVGEQHVVHLVDGAVPPDAVGRVHALCRMLPFTRLRYGFRGAPDEPLRHGWQWVHPVAEDERPLLPLARMAAVAAEVTGEALQPGRVHVNCIQPGDPRYPHIDDSTGRVVVAVYFANADWDPEWMGELTFFDRGEPVLAVSPRPGRILVFDGTLLHRGGVPATGCPEVRYAIAHKFLRTDVSA